ncbi:MAG TPA: hypothetical protein PLE30_02570 [Candidatus Kapabacteria bacterium]|nr:hypothetical protein [Candidatus Kapabacteria bacterium]
MYKYLILILLSLAITINSCDNKNPEEVKKEQEVNQEATDNFDALVEDGDSQSDTAATETVTTANSDTVKAEPDASSSSSAVDYSKKPLEGEIIVISDLMTGNHRKLTKDLAKQLVAKGEILAVKSANEIYFVYNADGSLASKNLASYANNSKVMMIGKAKVVDGLNVFIVTLMEGK